MKPTLASCQKYICAGTSAFYFIIASPGNAQTINDYFDEVDRLQEQALGGPVPDDLKLTRGTENYLDRNLVVFDTALQLQPAGGVARAFATGAGRLESLINASVGQVIAFWDSILKPEEPTRTTTTESTEQTPELSTPFRLSETQLQSSLAGSTTGLVSAVGDARPFPSPDLELERILSTEVRSPFVATVETPSTMATGNFTGEEGLNVAGVLNVFAFDSGNLQDGDRVRLTVRDSRGVVLRRNITLTFGGRTSRLSAQRGLVNVTITALNEGAVPPNTGGLRVSGDVAGSRSRNFNLRTGASGTIAVRVLGN